MAYDIIGDIHGQADKLHALLAHMGYEDRGGAYRHPSRTAIFVGDFIDKGPQQVESVMIVRNMVRVNTAQAVMGNHEFNAIAWHTPDPDLPGEFLRQHGGEKGEENRKQHEAFLAEVERDPSLHKEIIDWFMTLPLWLDLPGIRVVHACWHDDYMRQLKDVLTPAQQVTPELMVVASRAGRMEYLAVEGLTKGLEARLPHGHSFQDKYGYPRINVRIQWWEADATTYRDLAILPDEKRELLPPEALSHDARWPYDNKKPVFFGPYWMRGVPKAQSPTVACVDYSAADEGPLVAYRWDGEPALINDNFQQVG